MGRTARRHIQLKAAFVQLAFAQHGTKALAGAAGAVALGRLCTRVVAQLNYRTLAARPGRCRRRRQKQIKQALLGLGLGLFLHLLLFFFFHQVHCQLGEIADHGFHVSTHITHFGELGGLHLQKGALRQLGQAAGNLGFTHTGGANHDDVFRRDFLPQRWCHLLPAPAVSKRNGHRAFGIGLANHIVIQLIHCFLGGERGKMVFLHIVSTTMALLV